ncbi:MAG: PEP/pyruvate-binding domain-containing protein [Paludibacteraceae bacterium]|nr:PEP/pyruvate-binding domain-containing protein [Paludibacteraceae bacterium]
MNQSGILKNLYLKDTSFAQLMKRRIYNILLVASKYDSFTLEEDGRIDEQLFNEYTALNLRYPPRFTLAPTVDEAREYFETQNFELIIVMPTGDSSDVFEWAKECKVQNSHVPIVLLTTFQKEVFNKVFNDKDFSGIDYVFSWLGETDLMLAIVKLIEDKMNVDDDIASVGVQTILFVEDSPHFYSTILPYLYKYVFVQSRSFMTEALNDHERMLRMRGRPKIMLARSYEEAIEIYNRYSKNILGLVTDVRFPKNGEICERAGIDLCTYIRSVDSFLPIVIASTELNNKGAADVLRAHFIDKSSERFHIELNSAITHNFGFGDFKFLDPTTKEAVAVIRNLKELQDNIYKIPAESLYYHVSHNHLSRWLYSRAMFVLADYLRDIRVASISDIDYVRKKVFDAIVMYRRVKNKGVVATFSRDVYDMYSNFARIGDGSMGGKGRGLAFLDVVSKRNLEFFDFETTQIIVPKTVVICTDKFDEFMEMNKLYDVALNDKLSDEEILSYFIAAPVPPAFDDNVRVFLGAIPENCPIAVRSSSLLEDSHYQPFAGVYTTYMVPNLANDREATIKMLADAIKAVYASVYYQASKSYMMATKNVINREKMAVVLQEVCGTDHNGRFYPSFSGVARSLNYYPIGDEKSEEGVVNIALGLGKYIVDGGQTLRFSPKHSKNILQTSTLDLALTQTQTYFNAIDMKAINAKPKVDDGFNLLKLNLKDAEADGTLKYIASTFDPYDQTLLPGIYEGGRKVITFANILEHEVFPLADILDTVLKVGEREMGRPVEIEFAVNLDYEHNEDNKFYLLQIRPIVDSNKTIDEDLLQIKPEELCIKSRNVLGNGIINDIHDIVYVKRGMFNPSNNQLISYDIDSFNRRLSAEDKPYILIGPGRWGSSDTWLGIPVKWPNIAGAKVIVEAGETSYHIDPSQGTHFFQNMTSCGCAYFTVEDPDTSFCNFDFIEGGRLVEETKYIAHVHFPNPLVVKVDGKKHIGVVFRPSS